MSWQCISIPDVSPWLQSFSCCVVTCGQCGGSIMMTYLATIQSPATHHRILVSPPHHSRHIEKHNNHWIMTIMWQWPTTLHNNATFSGGKAKYICPYSIHLFGKYLKYWKYLYLLWCVGVVVDGGCCWWCVIINQCSFDTVVVVVRWWGYKVDRSAPHQTRAQPTPRVMGINKYIHHHLA